MARLLGQCQARLAMALVALSLVGACGRQKHSPAPPAPAPEAPTAAEIAALPAVADAAPTEESEWATLIGQETLDRHRAVAFLRQYPFGKCGADILRRLEETEEAQNRADKGGARRTLAPSGGGRGAPAQLPPEAVAVDALLGRPGIVVSCLGSGITSVRVSVTNDTAAALAVLVPAGMIAFPEDAEYQRMLVTASTLIDVPAGATTDADVPACCADRLKKVPGNRVKLTLRPQSAAAPLAKVALALDRESTAYNVEQAAVWMVSDNADYGDLGRLVLSWNGMPAGRAIRTEHVLSAISILDESGVAVGDRPLGRDRVVLLRSLTAKEARVRAWGSERLRQLDCDVTTYAGLLDDALAGEQHAEALSTLCRLVRHLHVREALPRIRHLIPQVGASRDAFEAYIELASAAEIETLTALCAGTWQIADPNPRREPALYFCLARAALALPADDSRRHKAAKVLERMASMPLPAWPDNSGRAQEPNLGAACAADLLAGRKTAVAALLSLAEQAPRTPTTAIAVETRRLVLWSNGMALIDILRLEPNKSTTAKTMLGAGEGAFKLLPPKVRVELLPEALACLAGEPLARFCRLIAEDAGCLDEAGWERLFGEAEADSSEATLAQAGFARRPPATRLREVAFGNDDVAKQQLVRLLRAFDTPADRTLLRQLLADQNPQVAADAARALAASLDDQEVTRLLWTAIARAADANTRQALRVELAPRLGYTIFETYPGTPEW